jgi:5,10-methylenetetrahydromethanopterin reductase
MTADAAASPAAGGAAADAAASPAGGAAAGPVATSAGEAIGLSIASHSGLPAARIGELAAAAERAGFGAVFVAEGHGDALSLCHPVAAATRRVRVGTAIANAALRPPVLAAKTAAQLDQAADGRFVLGLGVGNPVMNGRFGIEPFPALEMIEEYVAVIRAVLAGHPARHEGRVFRTGAVPLDSPPVRAGLPIYLGALGPRMLELAGRIADGVVLNLMSPAQAGRAASLVRTAAAAAGRDPAAVEIACVVHCCLSGDAAGGAVTPRDIVPRYVLHPAVSRLFAEAAPGSDLRPVSEQLLAGDRAGASARVPQPVADGFVAYGDVGACRQRLAEYRAAGVDLPVLFPMPVGGDWGYEEAIASFGPAGSTEPTGPSKEAVPSARNL